MAPNEPADRDPEVVADPTGEDDADGPVVDDTSDAALVPASAGAPARYDPFRAYTAELRKYPALSREEEQQLARRYRETGDRDALFRLVTSNLMLVVRVALSFRRAARNLLDLIGEGNLGLLQAIEKFDPEIGVRLPTYASYWVRAYMIKFLLDNVRLVRVGTTNARRKLLRNLRKERARLEAEGFEVGTKLLAEHFGVSEEDVVDVDAALSSRDVSIDAPVGEEGSPRPSDSLPATGPSVEESVARGQLQEQAEASIARFRTTLSDREKAILDDRILSEDPLTLQALGDRFGTSREAVRQAEARLMKRLREHLRTELGEQGKVEFDR
jgi:RNA polymerase sigma-32 factor